jgi:hypothetical protein
MILHLLAAALALFAENGSRAFDAGSQFPTSWSK